MAGANIFKIADASLPDLLFRMFDQISDPAIKRALESFVEPQLIDRVGISGLHFPVEALEYGTTVADLFERQQVGFVSVVEVGGAVGNFIGHIDKLRFERRTQIEQIFGE